jgi:hypothetical protein
MDFASVLGAAIPAHDTEIMALVANTVGGELRELTENFQGRKDTNVSGGREERSLARFAQRTRAVLAARRSRRNREIFAS